MLAQVARGVLPKAQLERERLGVLVVDVVAEVVDVPLVGASLVGDRHPSVAAEDRAGGTRERQVRRERRMPVEVAGRVQLQQLWVDGARDGQAVADRTRGGNVSRRACRVETPPG